MSRNKIGRYILFGAIAGALVSLSDRYTREQVLIKSKAFLSDVQYYSKNRDILKLIVQEKTEKYQSIYDQISSDASYLKEKVSELKELSPQVKDLVVDTKDAFSESKDEYKSIVNDSSTGEVSGK